MDTTRNTRREFELRSTLRALLHDSLKVSCPPIVAPAKKIFFFQRSFYFPFLRDGEADRDLLRCLAGEALLDLLLERLLDFLPPFLAGAGDRLAFDARLLGRLFDLLLERLLDLSFLSSALSSLSLRLLSGERDLDRLLDRDADFRSLDRRRGDRLRDRRRRGERLRDLASVSLSLLPCSSFPLSSSMAFSMPSRVSNSQ